MNRFICILWFYSSKKLAFYCWIIEMKVGATLSFFFFFFILGNLRSTRLQERGSGRHLFTDEVFPSSCSSWRAVAHFGGCRQCSLSVHYSGRFCVRGRGSGQSSGAQTSSGR